MELTQALHRALQRHPTKVALRHRAKSDATKKRRRPDVAALHGDAANTNNWWQGQPQRGLTCSFPGRCGQEKAQTR